MIKTIVEGHGEVEALPVLLRRIAGECFDIWDVPLLHPGRYPAGRLLRKDQDGNWVPGPDFPKAGQHARNEGATCILTLLDLDDDCPKEVYDALIPVLADATAMAPSCLVFAKCEYEAWFLASAETLEDNVLPYPDDPEGVRGAKWALESHLQLEFPYDERTDQPRYSSRMKLTAVYERSRSFRKLIKDYRRLLEHCGFQPTEWPPAGDG
ncbi:MAG: DUF4276 family protein [Verrucomicrobiota bacterium]